MLQCSGVAHLPIDLAYRRVIAPATWKVRTRRALLLTAPISVPVWLLAVCGFTLVMGMRLLWTLLTVPIRELWNAPPRRIRSGNSYGYGYGYGARSARRQVVDLEAHRHKRDAA